MPKEFTDQSKRLIQNTKKIAERFGNNYIGVGHFFLCANKYNQNGRISLALGYSNAKEWINQIKGKVIQSAPAQEKDFPPSVQLESAIKSSVFHCKVMGDKLIGPDHIYLGIIGADRTQKNYYLEVLEHSDIKINVRQRFLINFYFNSFCRTSGLTKLLY